MFGSNGTALQVFSIHPLTTEDIQMEETREKIELLRNYYFVCFRSFDQDAYSPTYLEPLNMYIIVFRDGILSVSPFRPVTAFFRFANLSLSSILGRRLTRRMSGGALSS